jgi:hypothetical protein
MIMRVCPFCKQDYVWEASTPEYSGSFYLCFECDTVWTSLQEMAEGNGQGIEFFMAARGQVVDCKAISKIRQVNDDT